MSEQSSAKVYRASSVITDKYQVEVTARDHTIILDEPKPVSHDAGMTPLEALLGAVGACKAIVAKATAAKMGIEYRKLEVIVEGDFDSRGYKGDAEIEIGFSEIRTIYNIDSDSSEGKLKQLIEYVDTHCPAAATLRSQATTKSSLKR